DSSSLLDQMKTRLNYPEFDATFQHLQTFVRHHQTSLTASFLSSFASSFWLLSFAFAERFVVFAPRLFDRFALRCFLFVLNLRWLLVVLSQFLFLLACLEALLTAFSKLRFPFEVHPFPFETLQTFRSILLVLL